MQYYRLDTEILSSVQHLNGNEKSNVLEYIKKMRSPKDSKRIYRRDAMKQIREALENI